MEDGLDDSASESLLVSIDTITSFIPEVFSWEDSSSSEGTRKEKTDDSSEKKTDYGEASFGWDSCAIDKKGSGSPSK